MKGQRQNLVTASELRKKKLAGVGKDVGRGSGGAGTGRRRHNSAGTAKKIRVPPGDETPGCCIAFP